MASDYEYMTRGGYYTEGQFDRSVTLKQVEEAIWAVNRADKVPFICTATLEELIDELKRVCREE